MTIGAFSFIFDHNGHILLCKRRDRDLWNLPGGRVEEGESPWDGAIREAMEEIGVEIKVEKLAGVYFKREQSETVFQFVASIVSGEPHTSDEVSEVQYFSMDALPQNIAPRQKERILLFHNDPGSMRIYTHV